MKINLDYSGRHVFVFGGTTGINFGVAQAFARQGAAATVASRSEDNVNAAVTLLEEQSAQVLGVCADVRNFDAVGQAFEHAVARFGPVDVLVSGAAGNFLCEASSMSSNGFRTVVDIDLVGTFHVLRQAHRHLRRPGGSVINITAPQASIPMRYQAHCGAAKAGVDQLTRILALEWGSEGLRINAISPGPIDGTEGVRRLMAPSAEARRAAVDAVPLKRLGTLDDIANLALFLGSPHAGYISGAVIPCDGGGALESVKPTLEAAGRAAASASHEQGTR
ncbi:short-chain dehydrogenase [Variovorax sp. WS11]|uniref:SDR family oxidoreductase n=1 Tax=Variovorax sp. WS11 TaxID=1105204 RepID=UPI000D0CFDEF|nr:SDR family oxidoreductase [Variovorax sp. WS11]NDZ17342.1 SDR family oxidoreductase [Variovorax sp. WS11]PSL86118.1 short-chain dehydrogenase [Variovorax sp. WS11]